MFPGFTTLLAFGALVALLTITPGLDTALVLRSAVVAVRSRAWGVVVGICSGTVVWGALTALGVSALLTASRLAYDALRWLGAAYLVYIGVRMLIGAIRPGEQQDSDARASGGFLQGLRQGLLTNLLNPKVGAFYVAVLPQFIPADAPQLAWGVSLALVHAVLGMVWLGALTLAARRASAWLRRRTVVRWIDGVAGGIIAALGVRLALVR